jgi:hypothetical protein
LANRAFRSRRGLVGGLALLVAGGLGTVGLSGCGAPAYSYVTDSAAKTYYKVPNGWHSVSQSALNSVLTGGQPANPNIWMAGFDADHKPSADRASSFTVSKPFAFSVVIQLSADATSSLSYNTMRDFLLPVTAQQRQSVAAAGSSGLSDFKQLRDDTITSRGGIHGVRETFQYTLQGVADTWDEDVLTNANQTVVYFLMVHCTNSCYSQNQADINTVMSSFTVGSP